MRHSIYTNGLVKLVLGVNFTDIFTNNFFNGKCGLSASFLCLQFVIVISCTKKIGAKAACKLLVKLITGVNVTNQFYENCCKKDYLFTNKKKLIFLQKFTTFASVVLIIVFDNFLRVILSQPNPLNLIQLGTSVRLTCLNQNWFFDYQVPANLTSFYYSNNIKSATLTCNIYR
jgi:hypothetical protein